jgi:hypothetical protein
MGWRDHLQQTLRAVRPARVCALDPGAAEVMSQALPDVPLHTGDAPPHPPCTLALGVDALTGLEARQAEQLVARVRTFWAPRMLLVAHAGCTLDEAAFRALGFELALVDVEATVRIYHYDIETYKTVPDWLNARFWAHPERWEP